MRSHRLFFSVLMALAIGAVMLVGCSNDQQSVTTPQPERVADQATVQPQGYGTQWPTYSQGYRNTLLLNVGYGDIGKSGGECKEWVRTIVTRTTDGRVTVPATMPNNYMWYSASHIIGQCMNIQNVQPGQVVQMSWTGHLHTFFLAGKNANGMYWLDSNWGLNGIVQYHYVSYATWNSFQNLRFSVYTIGW